MPRLPIDYSKGLIYKLVCRDLQVKDIYVGSTTDFTSRKQSHKQRCLNPTNERHNLYVYQFIRAYRSWEAWDMILIEPFPCENENELHARERHFIELLGATLNSTIPTRTDREYYEANKEKIDAYQARYRELHKVDIAAWKQEHYLQNYAEIRAKQADYYESHKVEIAAQSKAHRQENKEHFAAKGHAYYEAHKVETLRRGAVRIDCECGGHTTVANSFRHNKSQRHAQYMQSLQLPTPLAHLPSQSVSTNSASMEPATPL